MAIETMNYVSRLLRVRLMSVLPARKVDMGICEEVVKGSPTK